MSECTHDCSSCGEACSSRKAPQDFREAPNADSRIRKVIAVVSGKGGVGKSIVTSLLGAAMRRKGYKTAILDADITGPSIPNAFGLHERADGNEKGLLPVISRTGVEVMSLNLLLENENDPVVWRGPIIAGTVKQFWTDVIWNEVDYMFVDMPPGTGDVPLTVFQSLPVDGVVIVTSPQELVSMIVGKAVKMARLMNIPVLALVENMSYVTCPDCGKKIPVFGESRAEETAEEFGIPIACRMPIDPELAKACDGGFIEEMKVDWLDNIEAKLEEMLREEK